MDCQLDATGASPVAVTVGAAAGGVRREVGLTAWCALEVLAVTPAVDGDLWVVGSSVRDAATRLGVAPNAAQRALGVLRGAGLITVIQGRAFGGRLAASAYRLTVDTDVLRREPSKPAADRGQQLALLPSA
jgi:hypothetical protein